MDPFTLIGIMAIVIIGFFFLEIALALVLVGLRISYAVRGKRWKKKLYTLR